MKWLVLSTLLLATAAIAWAAEPQPSDWRKTLEAAIHKQCPDAAITTADKAFVAKNKTMTFTIHSVGMTGEIDPTPYQIEGPNSGGFLLQITRHEGRYDGQAVVPQMLGTPYYSTYVDAPATEDGKGYYQVLFSFGGRLDPELKKAIFAAMPMTNSARPADSAGLGGLHADELADSVVGELGGRLGQKMTIEGVGAEKMMLINPMMITTVDGAALKKPMPLAIQGGLKVEPGKHYRCEGYESGGFEGTPRWAGSNAQQSFHFETFFVVTKILVVNGK